jgi:hypothetical protein
MLSMRKSIIRTRIQTSGLVGIQKRNLGKLWQESGHQACKTAVNWVTRNIGRIVLMAVFEIWDTNLAKCEVTPQAIRPIA